jgi:uncharacterized protein YlxP (DUF503 family)
MDMRLWGCRSLKEKRGILKGVLARTRERFNASVAEVGLQDEWQRAVLGFATVGGDRLYVEGRIDEMVKFMENNGETEISGVVIEVFSVNTRPSLRGELVEKYE